MAKIVKISDFVGSYSISLNAFTGANLTPIINEFEYKYLEDLLGVELAQLFYVDITTPFTAPVTPIYATLFNPIKTNDINSNGILEMLKGFIHFEYLRLQAIKNTITGNVTQQNETTTMVDFTNDIYYLNYNKAIKTYQNIQKYITDNSSNYPLYDGKNKTISNWSI